jgi:signal transduction histidine kinase
VNSSREQGTTFTITLPSVKAFVAKAWDNTNRYQA